MKYLTSNRINVNISTAGLVRMYFENIYYQNLLTQRIHDHMFIVEIPDG